MIASSELLLITRSAWYCCDVTPAAQVAASLNAKNRRKAKRNPASPSYRLGSSPEVSPPLMMSHPPCTKRRKPRGRHNRFTQLPQRLQTPPRRGASSVGGLYHSMI